MRFLRVHTDSGIRLAADDGEGIVLFPPGAPQDYLSVWHTARGHGMPPRAWAEQQLRDEARLSPGGDGRNDRETPALAIPWVPPEVWGAAFTYSIPRPPSVLAQSPPRPTTGRPVVFFKATPHRCVGPDEPIGVRRDSRLMIPEPELAVIIGADGEIIGYLAANDVSARDFPMENPFYMDSSKVFARCCALGPAIVPPGDVNPMDVRITCRVRRGDRVLFEAEGTTARLNRSLEELVEWTCAHADVPAGAVLCTGTAVSPPADLHLVEGDVVEVDAEGIGLLRNPVVAV